MIVVVTIYVHASKKNCPMVKRGKERDVSLTLGIFQEIEHLIEFIPVSAWSHDRQDARRERRRIN